ncbi:MAG: hypothetical protein JRF33_03610 [Deltaproteobacteria bacterium]|nr:hypothetical protein [Deltaproteobacteria bacterium]
MYEPYFTPYSLGEGYKAVELPYAGEELSMLVLLPDPGEFYAFEASLAAEVLKEIVTSLEEGHVRISMPRWTFKSPSISLKSLLSGLGMPAAFDPQQADFSGMTGTNILYLGDVHHKAFVTVNEVGTEAAAASTASAFYQSGQPEAEIITLDRPFIYLIRDRKTDTMLFMGRIMDPS